MLKTAMQIADEILTKLAMPVRFIGHNVPKVTPEALSKAEELIRRQIAALDKTPGRLSNEASQLGNQAKAVLADPSATGAIPR